MGNLLVGDDLGSLALDLPAGESLLEARGLDELGVGAISVEALLAVDVVVPGQVQNVLYRG